MPGATETDVVVVGAGPVGLSMAIALRYLGVECVVVEKHESTLDFPRGRGVSIRTMELMRRWGLEDDLVAAGLPRSQSLALFSADSLLAPEFNRTVLLADRPMPFSPTLPLICDQEAMEVVLRRAAVTAGTDLRFGCEVADVIDDGNAVTAVVVDRASGRQFSVTAPWMVAADGAHSPTRARLGIGRHGPGVVSNAVSILIEAALGSRMVDRASALYRIDGLPGGAVAAVDNDRRWLLIYRYDPVVEPPESFTAARLRELAGLAIGEPDMAFRIVGHRFWESTALVSDRYRQGRIFLVGDAAHVVTPLGGLGMNCGIADVDNLSWKLAGVISGWAYEALLETFEPERRPVAEVTAQASLGRSRLPASVDGLILGTRYESAAICPDGTVPPEPDDPIGDYVPAARPGHRAPHLWLDDSQTRSTLDLFGASFVLLTPPAGAEWRAAATEASRVPLQTYEIGVPDWPALYGIESEGAVLVRPDGYVAWRAQHSPADRSDVTEALRQSIADI